jgi:hypothetical protein
MQYQVWKICEMKYFSKYFDSTIHEETEIQHRIQNIEYKQKSTLRKAKPRELQHKIFIPHHHHLSRVRL